MNPIESTISPVNDFNRYAVSYDQFARIQQLAADDLGSIIESHKHRMPNTNILELGAGTGFLTEQLLRRIPHSIVIATDISEGMLDVLQNKMGHSKQLKMSLMDANHINGAFSEVGSIVSGLTIQWLLEPVKSIHQWMNSIHPEGVAFISWLGNGSFPEWKSMTKELGVSYTGNSLPGNEVEQFIRNKAELNIIEYQIQHRALEFDSALSFFKSIRNIGASTETNPNQEKRNLLRLCSYWDEVSPKGVSVDHELHYLVLEKIK